MVGTILAYVKWNGICRRGLDSCDSVVDSCKSFPVPLQTGRRNNLNIWAAAVFSNNTSIYRSQYDTNTTRGYWGAYLRTAGWRIVCVCVCVCVYIQRERERERGEGGREREREGERETAILFSMNDTVHDYAQSSSTRMKITSLLEHKIPDKWTRAC